MMSMPLVMLVVTRPLSMTMPLQDVWQMVVIIMESVVSHVCVMVVSPAMNNGVDCQLTITNTKC